jgi:hypothetical protein
MPKLRLQRAALLALTAGSLVSLSAKTSRAEQFVLFDQTFTMTWEDAISSTPSKSHHYVKANSGLNPMQPSNWVSPIDYRNGKVHIHLEVLDKPAGGQKQGWALCYVGKAGSYGCPYTDYYTEEGVYDKEVSMTNFYNDDTIDWTKGIAEVDLIYTINDSGSGHVHFFPELKDKTTPTTVRIAMVQVSAGSTYDGSVLPGGAGGSGGTGGSGGAATGGGGSGGVATSGGAGGSAGGGNGGALGAGGNPVAGGASNGGAASGGSAPSGGAASGASSVGGVTSAGSPATSGGAPVTGTGPLPTEGESGCSLAPAPRRSGAWLALGLLAWWAARRRVRA